MLRFIVKLLAIIIIAAPIYILVRRPFRREIKRECLLMAFWLFNAALLVLALNGDYGTPGDMLRSAYGRIVTGEGINLIPLRTVKGFFADSDTDRFLVNIIGNTVMFMPWGFGLVFLWERNRRPLRIIGLSLAITAFIEFCQMFIGRAVDVDDMLLNFAGSMLGAFVWYAARNIYRKIREVKSIRQA